MKLLFALTVLAALVAPTTLAAPVHDQLKNGGLEDWESATSPAEWTVEVGTVERSADATEGNFSAKLRAMPNELGGHYSILAQTMPQSDTDLPIVPGAFYDLSFDAKGIYNDKGIGRANVTWVGVNGAVLRIDVFEIPENANQTWESFTARLQAPYDPLAGDLVKSATLRFRVDGQSSDQGVNLWVDNARFGLGSPI